MTLNFMIMFAMLLAVGILVDGAIIVVEYADRKMTEGHTPKQAFAEAALRMFWPVVSATATMIGAFLPMLLWPGVAGQVHELFPDHAHHRAVGVDGRGADLPAGARRHRSARRAAARRSSTSRPSRRPRPATGARSPASPAGMRIWPSVSRSYPGPRDHAARCGIVVAVHHAVHRLQPRRRVLRRRPIRTIASVLISARGNLSADEKRDIVMGVERHRRRPWTASSTSMRRRAARATRSTAQGGVPVDNIGQHRRRAEGLSRAPHAAS